MTCPDLGSSRRHHIADILRSYAEGHLHLECFAADIVKPQDIAEVLGLPQREADIALRRFKRRAQQALKEFKK